MIAGKMAVENKNSIEKNEKSHWWDSKPLKWGVILSVIYLGTFISFLYLYGEMEHVEADADKVQLLMSWNEIGDFFAGAAAPLAFVWLVVAVFLQKNELSAQLTELKVSTKALQDQGYHLRQQAELQKKNEAVVEFKIKVKIFVKEIAAELQKIRNPNAQQSKHAIIYNNAKLKHLYELVDQEKYDEGIEYISTGMEYVVSRINVDIKEFGDFQENSDTIESLMSEAKNLEPHFNNYKFLKCKQQIEKLIAAQKEFEKNNP